MEAKDYIIAAVASVGTVTGGTSLYQEKQEEDLTPRVAVLEAKVLRAQQDTKEIKTDVKDNGKKLDELKTLIIQGR